MKEEKDIKDTGDLKKTAPLPTPLGLEKDQNALAACVAMVKSFTNLISDTETAFRSAAEMGKGLRDAMYRMIVESKDQRLLRSYCLHKSELYDYLPLKEKVKYAQSFGFLVYCKIDGLKKFFKRLRRFIKDYPSNWVDYMTGKEKDTEDTCDTKEVL